MRIQRALGIAGGAGGVAQAGSRVLVELRPRVVAVLRVDQVLVAQQRNLGVDRHVRAVAHHHPALHARAMRRHAFHQRQEGGIEEHVLVFGVVDDVGDLLGEQARVDGMAYRSRARYAVVDLQVTIAIPGQRADTVARLHAQRGDGLGQLARAQLAVAVGITVQIAFGPSRDDFRAAIVACGVLDDGGNEQGFAHHLTHQCHGIVSCDFSESVKKTNNRSIFGPIVPIL